MSNFRSYFTGNLWWGKILGAFFGYLMGRATGAFIGIIIGNFFDRALSEYFSRPDWQTYLEKNPHIQGVFLECTFKILGHIAKTDGRVSEEEIILTKKFMDVMRLTKKQKILAEKFFNQGKQPNFNVELLLTQFNISCRNNASLLHAFLDMQYRMVKQDGINGKKIKALNNILVFLGISPIHQQNRFYEQFNAGSSSHYQRREQQQNSYTNNASSMGILDQAYSIIGVKPSNTQDEIKTAYRRLISRNHPDKLIAKGASEAAIKAANNKTQAIRKAYEQICASRGW